MPDPLTERELDILRLLAEGMSNREIGNKLSLTKGTVKNYVTNVLQKMVRETERKPRCADAN